MDTLTLTTPRLSVRCLQAGPASGQPVLLLHGFPDDATCWQPVMESLSGRGYRAIAPFNRGCGGTRFLSPETPRAGDFAALGQDALDLVDVLDLRDLVVVGQDWGSPTAEIVAMLRPERVRHVVKLNWYGVYSMHEVAQAQGFSYPQLRTLWYVWMLNTPVGEMALRFDRAGLARALWAEWSPTWTAAAREAALGAVLPSLEGDDWAQVALSAYRQNMPGAISDARDGALRAELQQPRPLACKATIIHGADDGVERSPLDDEARKRWFPAGLAVRALPEVGHFPQREAPDAVGQAIMATLQ